MITPEIAERHLIDSVQSIKEFRICQEYGITKSYFSIYGKLWEFLEWYYESYKNHPSREILKEKFPDFQFGISLPVEPCIDSFLENYCKTRLFKFFNDSMGFLEDSPRYFVKQALKILKEIDREQKKSSFSIFDLNPLERLDRHYQKMELRQKMGLLGIPSGLPTIDRHFQGWQPGNLIAIIARSGQGKSWTLSYFAIQAHIAKKKVIFISPEMVKEEVEDRLDTLYAYILKGYNIKNSSLRSGFPVNVDHYKDYLSSIGNDGRFFVFDSDLKSPFAIGSIEYLIEEHKPDIVAVDSVPLLETGSGGSHSGSDWTQFLEVSYGLKKLSVSYDIPILVTSQANRKVESDTSHPTMEQISYGDSLAQACDVIISIAKPNRNVDQRKVRTLKVLKARGADLLYDLIYLTFDVDNGIMMEREETT